METKTTSNDADRWHSFLCHGDGSSCEGVCARAPDPRRLADFQRYKALTGADKLRAVVVWIDYHREDFNDRFSLPELVALWEHGARNGHRLAEFADTWDQTDVIAALREAGLECCGAVLARPDLFDAALVCGRPAGHIGDHNEAEDLTGHAWEH